MENLSEDQKLSRIEIKYNSDFVSVKNEILAEEITFFFETCKLTVLPRIETDEIAVSFNMIEKSEKLKPLPEEKLFPEFIGKSIGYMWNCVNSNGYSDVFIIGFGHLHPSILILSEGSCLKLFDVRSKKRS
jgi:hypothetical protein